MKRLNVWGSSLLMAAALMTLAPGASLATMADEGQQAQNETEIRNGWLDEKLGPGVAKWVDENGNITEPPAAAEDTPTEAGITDNGSTVEGQADGTAEDTSAEDTQSLETEQPAGRQIDPERPMVALTFDDGPYAPVGNQIMDCLALYGGKATFYVVGNRAASYPAELQRMVAEGHEIGNHTYDHKYLSKLSVAQMQYQINRCSDVVFAITGVRPTTVRPPGGYKNGTVLANANGPVIMWSIDTLDWKHRNASKSVNAVMSKVRDGDIILMHELYSQSGAAAAEIIPRLVEQGYQLVTVSELAQYRGGAEAGREYSQFYR